MIAAAFLGLNIMAVMPKKAAKKAATPVATRALRLARALRPRRREAARRHLDTRHVVNIPPVPLL